MNIPVWPFRLKPREKTGALRFIAVFIVGAVTLPALWALGSWKLEKLTAPSMSDVRCVCAGKPQGTIGIVDADGNFVPWVK